jgi:hypothetical protein
MSSSRAGQTRSSRTGAPARETEAPNGCTDHIPGLTADESLDLEVCHSMQGLGLLLYLDLGR